MTTVYLTHYLKSQSLGQFVKVAEYALDNREQANAKANELCAERPDDEVCFAYRTVDHT